MRRDELRREGLYLTTMKQLTNMMKSGLISDGEYSQMDEVFRAKYGAVFSTLFTDIDLIN